MTSLYSFMNNVHKTRQMHVRNVQVNHHLHYYLLTECSET